MNQQQSSHALCFLDNIGFQSLLQFLESTCADTLEGDHVLHRIRIITQDIREPIQVDYKVCERNRNQLPMETCIFPSIATFTQRLFTSGKPKMQDMSYVTQGFSASISVIPCTRGLC